MMRRNIRAGIAAIVLCGLLAACDEDQVAEAPPALDSPGDATGYFCGMLLSMHAGPRGQIQLEGGEVLWFSSVRDIFSYREMPEEAQSIAAIYVTDIGQANWDSPEPGTWVAADQAVYVIGSERRGGMGGEETVPFSDRAAAEAFVAEHGGRIVEFDDMPMDYILHGEVGDMHGMHGMGDMSASDAEPDADADTDAGDDGHDHHQNHGG